MDSAGLRWYRTGTVNITQGSTNITGVGTNWQTAGIQPGDVFMVGNSVLYEIAQVADNTNIVLQSAFQGATGTGQNYSILRNFAGTMQAQIAAQVSELVNKYESYIDTELKQIVGPAGPTSFPYRGTWATGRQYNALDVVQYGTQLYMALAGHTSTSENAPGAPNTEWMVLQVGPGMITTSFAKGFRIIPNGEVGMTLIGGNEGYDAKMRISIDKIQVQKTKGSTTTDLAIYYPSADTGWQTLTDGLEYRKKNGVIFLNMNIFTNKEIAAGDSLILGTLPSGFAPDKVIRTVVGSRVSNVMVMVRLLIGTNGNISIYAYGGGPIASGTWLEYLGSFPVGGE